MLVDLQCIACFRSVETLITNMLLENVVNPSGFRVSIISYCYSHATQETNSNPSLQEDMSSFYNQVPMHFSPPN